MTDTPATLSFSMSDGVGAAQPPAGGRRRAVSADGRVPLTSNEALGVMDHTQYISITRTDAPSGAKKQSGLDTVHEEEHSP